MQACNYSTWELEEGGSEVQNHSWLYREFEASMEFTETPFQIEMDR